MVYTCPKIDGTILLNPDSIRCSCSNAGGIVFFDKYKGEEIDFEKIDTKREEIITAFKRGIAPYCCFQCSYKQKVDNCDLKISKTLKQIYISNWRHCNCGCIYCDYGDLTKGEFSQSAKKSDYYDALPILKKFVEEGRIDQNTEIVFLGGECTVLEEFEPIVDLLFPIVEKRILIFSSGIIPSPSIKKLLSADKCMLVTSLDSGCRETYRKIKRTDAFEQVINTLKEYKKSAGENFKHVTLKYILLPQINDNKEEISKFTDVIRALGVQNAFLEVDHRDILARNREKIPEHYYDLVEFFKKSAPELHTENSRHNKLIWESGYIF